MSIRMHRYPNGQTGLAAFCDTCGEQITKNGYVVWKTDPETYDVTEWLVIHQGTCDPGRTQGWSMSMPLAAEIVYLANSAGIDIESAIEEVITLDTLA